MKDQVFAVPDDEGCLMKDPVWSENSLSIYDMFSYYTIKSCKYHNTPLFVSYTVRSISSRPINGLTLIHYIQSPWL
jgi:hypothetical protein